MRIEATGYFRIITNKETKQSALRNIECYSYDVDDYAREFDFSYEAVFNYVLESVGYAENHNYAIPTTKEEFHQSPLWKDLGFKVDAPFEVQTIIKYVEIEYYMSYGQKAELTIDLASETVCAEDLYKVHNALDNVLFGIGPLCDDDNCYNGIDVISDLEAIYSKGKTREDIAREVHNLLGRLHREEGEPLSEDEINSIIDAMF